jgi:hypothetical protein
MPRTRYFNGVYGFADRLAMMVAGLTRIAYPDGFVHKAGHGEPVNPLKLMVGGNWGRSLNHS